MRLTNDLKNILEKYELGSISDMILELQPKGYNVSALQMAIAELDTLPDKTVITVSGYIDSFSTKALNATLDVIEGKLINSGSSVKVKWISNNKYSKKMLYSLTKATEDDTFVQVSGKLESWYPNGKDGVRYMSIANAKLEPIEEDEGSNRTVIVPEPQYLLRKGTKYHAIKNAFRHVIKNIDEVKADLMPVELEKLLGLQPLVKSLKFMHGMKPINIEKIDGFLKYDGFKRRINAEKIYKVLSNAQEETEKDTPSITYGDEDQANIKKVLKKLPFELTIDQKKTIHKMLTLFSKKTGTKSLVYGDVGSGKTLVALIEAYILQQQGYQVVVMTPTGILTKQHFEEAKELLGRSNVEFINSKTTMKKKTDLNKKLQEGKPLIVFGTTSVNNLDFTNLKAVYIDEEQKIGVEAKEKLFKKFNEKVHIIFMTATPIPRTLASSVFTNFNVFQIKVKPSNRLPRITKLFDFSDSIEINNITERINLGQQTLVVVPSIDSEEMVNAEDVFKKYKKLFPSSTIKMINGRLDKTEVEKIISDYMDGKFDMLIATVMVDSGFSNKNIAHVFIEGSDRFGMSQLHQIRGRCGRGELQGFCYLIPSHKSIKAETLERLNTIVNSEDGFELSEKDIQLRGSGDLSSTQQSGMEINFIDWMHEIDVIKEYFKNNK